MLIADIFLHLYQVAAGRILKCLDADANVTVICPADGLNDEVAYRVEQKQVAHVDRNFEPSDLDGVDMVMCAVDDPAASTEVWKLCKKLRIAANIADVPPECDFYFGSEHRDGPLQIMISTNGNGPRLANIIRRKIQATLPANAGEAIRQVGALRKKLRKVAPNIEEGPKRMKWFVHLLSVDLASSELTCRRMIKVSDAWSLENLVDMTEQDMDDLLKYYEPFTVPSLEQIRLGEEPGIYEFDGSFGWSI